MPTVHEQGRRRPQLKNSKENVGLTVVLEELDGCALGYVITNAFFLLALVR